MANLTAPRQLEFVGEQEEIAPKLTASVTYYKGGLLVYTSGYGAKPTDAAALYGAGILTGEFSGVGAEGLIRDDAYAIGATALRGKIKRGKVWLPVSGAVQADVGVLHYIADDQTMTKTAGTKTIAYTALDFKTGFLLFDLRQPIKAA
jgi:hypothetical protein